MLNNKEHDFSTLKKMIDEFEYISFDMFDTLIKRDCYCPTELFRILEKNIDSSYKMNSCFSDARIMAEKKARSYSKTGEEVTLSEIYKYLECDFNESKKLDILRAEERYEYAFCQMNPLMKSTYEYCLLKNKKIIIITDTYLPESLIKDILTKVGIKYNELFVSSTLGLTKARGSLFLKALECLDIKSSELLHIGDNIQSDYKVPKKLGIKSILIGRNQSINLFKNDSSYNYSPDYANLCAFISNHSPLHFWNAIHPNDSEDFFAQAGYEIQGPVLYGFINWLQVELKKEHIDKVFFLARDGQIIQKAYNKLEDCIPNVYMYASRKALIIPTIWMNPELDNIKEIMYWAKAGSIPTFMAKIGLSYSSFAKEISEYGFSDKKIYVYNDLWRNPAFLRLYDNVIKPAAIRVSKQKYDILVTYLKQLHFPQRAAIVDIGWFGHMQAALQKVIHASGLPIQLYGYYIGLRPESSFLKTIRAKGYLFDRNCCLENSWKEPIFNAIVEALFTADHGTTKGYELEDGLVTPILEDWEYDNENLKDDYSFIRAAQTGALNCVDDMLNMCAEFRLSYDAQITFINWLQLGCKPFPKCAKKFGDLHILDDDIHYIAKPKENFNYLIHIRSLLHDLRQSHWIFGFLTRLSGNSIPWFGLYQLLHQVHRRIR